jgi:hypothetical protein
MKQRGFIGIIIIFIVLALLIVGGMYLFKNSQNSARPSAAVPVEQSEDVSGDLNSINIESVEADFETVDQDLQTL